MKKLNQIIPRYISIKQDHLVEFNRIKKELDIESCIGVHIRGTDMNNTEGHIKPKSVEEVIFRVASMRKKMNFDKIFLCTDEENIKTKFIKAFDGSVQVVCLDTYRSNGNQEGLHLEKRPNANRINHRYRLGLEVLRDAFLLSHCRSLICGHSNVAYAAIIFNNNRYEWIDCQ